VSAPPPVAGPPARLPAADLARRLGVSAEAVALLDAHDLIDLHIDTFIPPRLWGYDPLARHAGGPLGHRFFGHLDLPRIEEHRLAGAMWSITTNPFRGAAARWRTFLANLSRFRELVARSAGRMAFAPTLAAYRAARARGAHAVLLSIQGANALEAAPEGPASIPEGLVVRATLVHLTNSVYGATSSPHHLLRADKGLTRAGAALVEALNAARVGVDLAHIHPRAFADALAVHDRTQPLLATHTGVSGVRPHWRNLDDAQLRAIAATGGTVGVIFSRMFLARRGGPVDAGMVVEHLAHIVDTVGEAHASIGSDYDGAITPPADIGRGEYARVVQKMLDRGWSDTRIAAILGGNALRVFGALRPGSPP